MNGHPLCQSSVDELGGAITRGCYWGKCVFCTLHKVIGPGYRGRSIERTVEDIRFLKDRWGSRLFYFATHEQLAAADNVLLHRFVNGRGEEVRLVD